jgi:drug/metabolite transporter (DMT)-like permease
MLGAVLCFVALAITARELLKRMGAFEVVLMRCLAMFVISGVLLAASGSFAAVRTQRFGLHAARNLSQFTGQVCWVFALGALPLATVFAIEFTIPVFTALLAALTLGERLTGPRIVMLVSGLAGVAIILRPGLSFIHPAALVMLFGTAAFAVQFILSKRLSTTESALTVVFWMSVIQIPFSLAGSLAGWVWPSLTDLPWIALLGAASYVSNYCILRAMKVADTAVVVPVDFVRLPLISVIGALFYGEAFDPMVFVGAAVIFAGTWFSLARERR